MSNDPRARLSASEREWLETSKMPLAVFARAALDAQEKAEADRDKFRGYFEANAKAHHEVKKERDAALEQARIADSRYQANLGDRKRLMDERDAALAAAEQCRRTGDQKWQEAARLRKALEGNSRWGHTSHRHPGAWEDCQNRFCAQERAFLAGDGKGAARVATEPGSKPAPAKPASACPCWVGEGRTAIGPGDCVQDAKGVWHWSDCPALKPAPPPAAEGCKHTFQIACMVLHTGREQCRTCADCGARLDHYGRAAKREA